jgi:hypothetical protein
MKTTPLLLLFCALFSTANAQTDSLKTTQTDKPKMKISHSVYGSVGLIYVGLGYDARFRLLPNATVDLAASIGYGAGVFSIAGLESSTSFTNIPLSLTVLSTKGKHCFESGLTIEYKNAKTTVSEVDTVTFYTNKYVAFMPTLGYRYQENGFSPLIKVQAALGAGRSNCIANRPLPTSNGQIILDGFIRASFGFSF